MYHTNQSYKKHSTFIEDLTPNAEKMMFIFFHLSVASAFYGSAILSFDTPVGSIFPFRILLPITALVFLKNCFIIRKNPFKNLNKTKKWGLIFGVCLLAVGTLSLFRAISFEHTFKRLFNLSFVVLLFFIVLLYIDNHQKFKSLVYNLTFNTTIILILGVIETFGNNYIFIDKYIGKDKYSFFDLINLKPATVSFTNTNDLNAGIFMVITLISCYYIYSIIKSNNKKLQNIYGLTLIFLFVTSYYLTECSGARLVKFSFYIYVLMMFCVFYVYSKKKLYIPAIILAVGIVLWYGGDYYNINARAINTTNDAVYFTQKTVYDLKISFGDDDATEPIRKPHIPLRDKIALEEEFFAQDKDGNNTINLTHSGGVRLALIEEAFKMFAHSKTLGVGLGNGEMILKASPEKTGGITNFHCYPARLIAEYGIFILIPCLMLGVSVVKDVLRSYVQSRQKRDASIFVHIITVIAGLFVFPFLVTAPSDAQDIAVMWIYIAFYICALSASKNGDVFYLFEDKDSIDFQRVF